MGANFLDKIKKKLEELSDYLKIINHYKTNNKIKIDVDFNPSQML